MMQIGRNIFSLLLSRTIAGIILFLVYTKLTGYLGPEALGQFGLLSVYLVVFSLFVDLGMSQLVIKKISEDREHTGKYLSSYFFIQTALGVFFMVIMDIIVYVSNYPDIVRNSLFVAGFALLFSSMSLPFRSVINAHQRLSIIAKINFFNSVINGGFMIAAIVFQKYIFFLAFIGVTVAVFDLIVYWIIVQKHFAKFEWQLDKVFARQLIILNAPFMLLTLFSVYNRIDTILLSQFRSFEEVGYYSAAYKFWDLLAFIPNVIAISLYPFFAHAIVNNRMTEVKKGLETYTRYMAALAFPLAVGTFILANKLTIAIYGQDFAPAAPALWLLVTAVAILILYAPVNSLVISQQTKAATWVTGTNLFVNLIANLILIQMFGFVAAAAVTVCSELFQLICYTLIVKKRVTPFRFIRSLYKPIVSSIIMAGIIYLFRDLSVWYVVLIGAGVYSGSLLVLGFLQTEDWALFKAAVDIRKPIQIDPNPPTQ